MTHRLFFGIQPPDHIRDALIATMHGIDRARWQDDDQLHLTLRYIGEVDHHQAEDLAHAAFAIAFASFEIAVRGVGSFERKGVSRAVWAGIEGSDALISLHRKLELACQRCGLAPEPRKFHPHITLARLNQSSGSPAPYCARHAALTLGPWLVERYILYESHLREQGSLYEPMVTFTAGKS